MVFASSVSVIVVLFLSSYGPPVNCQIDETEPEHCSDGRPDEKPDAGGEGGGGTGIPGYVPYVPPEAPPDGEDEEEDEPPCKIMDKRVDELAREPADELRELCFHEDGTFRDIERAVIIYNDFTVGDVYPTSTLDGFPNRIEFEDAINEDGRDGVDVIATLHCGTNWSTEPGRSDQSSLDGLGNDLIEVAERPWQARRLRHYLVTKD